MRKKLPACGNAMPRLETRAPQNLSEEIALVAVLKTYARHKDLCKGIEAHAGILRHGLLRTNVFIGSTLVHMYAKCGTLSRAHVVFDELPIRNVVSWTGLITGYAQHGHGEKALICFERMQEEGLSPNAVTFSCILKACGSVQASAKGEEIHADLAKMQMLDNDNVLGNAVIDMYVKCGALGKARQAFDEHPIRDVVSWNTLIAGFCQHGHCEEALDCYERMCGEGILPDSVTFLCVLKACASLETLLKGKDIHVEIAQQGLLREDKLLGNALVDMYVKCGALPQAQLVFDKLPVQNVVSWTTLIAGYYQHGHSGEALDCFEHMKEAGLSPDVVAFACILKACGSIGAAERGEEIHAEIVREGLLKDVTVLGSALVDMYAKCGILVKAQEVFDKLLDRDVVSWTALIAGYCQVGNCEKALKCFEQMRFEGLTPDAVTLTCVLKVCGILGAAEKGQMLYETMSKSYGIVPDIEHHSCLVDLFSREGHLDKAVALVKQMPSSCYLSSWFAVLDACLRWGNEKMGSFAFNQGKRLDYKSGFLALAPGCVHASHLK